MKTNGGVLSQVRTLFDLGAIGRLPDGALLAQFISGQPGAAEAAFNALVERHGPMVYSVCLGILKDPHDTEDAFQATFLILVRKAGAIRRQETLGYWLYGVARRVAVRAKLRTIHKRAIEQPIVEELSSPPMSSSNADCELALLHQELARLPEKYRRPVVLCHLEGMTYEAAASSLRLSESTVRGRLARARQRLRERLSRQGVCLSPSLLAATLRPNRMPAPHGSLTRSTTRAAVAIVSGRKPLADAVSAPVAALAEGVSRSMSYSQWKLLAVAGLAFGLLAAGAGAGVSLVSAGQETNGRRQVHETRESGRGGASRALAVIAGSGNSSSQAALDPDLEKAVSGRIVKSIQVNKDCMVLSYLPDWAYGNVDNIGVGNGNGGNRMLLDWPAVSPEDTAVPNRRFLLAVYSRSTNAEGSASSILAFEVSQDWQELTSWKTQPEYAAEPSGTYKFEPGAGWKLFDVTPMIQARAKTRQQGHGLLLRFLNEDMKSAKKNLCDYKCVSREGTGEWQNRRPLLLLVVAEKK
jgi:RNA polymerase sigma factor (sigma-70 family)